MLIPKPKKLSPDSTTIIPSNVNVACTITTLKILGSKCFNIILYVGVPIDCAAKSTHFFSCSTLPLTNLAMPPQLSIIITNTKMMAEPYGFLILSPNAAFKTIAKLRMEIT